jgi:hypothetical protein
VPKDLEPSKDLQSKQLAFPVNLDVYDSDGKPLPSTGSHGIGNEQKLKEELALYREGSEQLPSGASIVLTDATGTTIQAKKS